MTDNKFRVVLCEINFVKLSTQRTDNTDMFSMSWHRNLPYICDHPRMQTVQANKTLHPYHTGCVLRKTGFCTQISQVPFYRVLPFNVLHDIDGTVEVSAVQVDVAWLFHTATTSSGPQEARVTSFPQCKLPSETRGYTTANIMLFVHV